MMKLSKNIQEINRVYDELMLEATLYTGRHEYAFDYMPRCPNHILPRERQHSRSPKLPVQYSPTVVSHSTAFQNKERLVLLTAFQASYPDTTTLITPNMVPLIIDTGASVTITPFKSDFITPIRPVQQV
jgi:hypothetical protein